MSEKNPHREITATIDGEAYVLKPNFAAIGRVCGGTDMGLAQLMGAIAALRPDVAATIIFLAIDPKDRNGLTLDEVGDAVLKSIVTKEQDLLRVAVEFVNSYLTTENKTSGKKPKAKAEVATTAG